MIFLDFIAYVFMCVIGVVYHTNLLIGPAGICCLVLGLWLWPRILGE